jgi:asparagine synthase (glutamine-hydrolysing)
LESQRLLAEMARRLSHRGPDGWGAWTDDSAGLAHTRLAVIDTSHAGDQPMHDGTGQFHVVFNGEIYNFLALREELRLLGHRFRSRSDTEVLIYGFKEWGTKLFRRLVGMFALGIWDSKAKRLVLARDRFGEKPLYYCENGRKLIFASEIKAILAHADVLRRPNRAALHDYLTFAYTVGPETAFEGIRRLQPAHYLVLEAGKPPLTTQYWRLPDPAEQQLADVESVKIELVERLKAAVRSCLISDVPLGAFLSGGVDSSAVVAMMRQEGVKAIQTFSSGFEFANYDETAYAKIVADRCRTEHQVFIFNSSLLASLPKLAWHYGEPYADSSALVTFALAEKIRQSVTVALTGDGADELLLGYQRYFKFKRLLKERPAVRLLENVYRRGPWQVQSADPFVDTYGNVVERFSEQHKLLGYDLNLLATAHTCSYDRLRAHLSRTTDPIEAASRFDVGTYLPDDILVKVDVATMAHGLESRCPFLNHTFAEYVASIPTAQRVLGNEGKGLLKSALEPYVPKEVMYRTKMGFAVPVAHFMRTTARSQTAGLLMSDRFSDRRLIRPAYVKQLLEEHWTGDRSRDHGTKLWTLICLEMWFRTFIDDDGSKVLSDVENPFAEFAASKAESERDTPQSLPAFEYSDAR